MPAGTTTGKTLAELTGLVEDAIRAEPGCDTARVPAVQALDVRNGRNWEIPRVVLGDSLISDVDRAVMSVQRRLGREFHLVTLHDVEEAATGPAGAAHVASEES
ncbi:hypothetical protein BRADO5555 [Bradyrhizobium sp. ORS 278]|uniref:hypothetical protein n=1 Tax=Bradyrhizobium sp. (strain ORS 278) TaxID=114615 RepID=UPI00015089D8|nr:hypothetical protein [Bradyrhizobium sp. ORS 278]CAL79229.1 hypothetical protein BRADO5555 [Bradyrhizobium sp. ORS 278]